MDSGTPAIKVHFAFRAFFIGRAYGWVLLDGLKHFNILRTLSSPAGAVGDRAPSAFSAPKNPSTLRSPGRRLGDFRATGLAEVVRAKGL